MGKRLDPILAAKVMIKAGAEPLVPYPGAGKPWLCRCLTCLREITPSYHSIQKGQGCCVYCSGKKIDLVSALQLMKSAGFNPLVDFPGDKAPWLCRCITCQRESSPRYNDVHAGHGCRHCWEDRRGDTLRLDHDLAVSVMHLAGFKPTTPYPGSDIPWPSTCVKCHRKSSPCYSSARNGHGCRYCGAEQRGERRRLTEDIATSVMHAAGLTPLEPYPTALQPWRCQCQNQSCRSILTTLSYSKVQSGRRCHACRERSSGFDRTKPGWVYLLFHPEHEAVKVGVTVVGAERIRQHQLRGWRLFRQLPCATGEKAWRIEQRVLKFLRIQGIRPYLTAELMPQGGQTETVDAELVPPLEMWKLIQAEATQNH